VLENGKEGRKIAAMLRILSTVILPGAAWDFLVTKNRCVDWFEKLTHFLLSSHA
jgi:hypothetical protein